MAYTTNNKFRFGLGGFGSLFYMPTNMQKTNNDDEVVSNSNMISIDQDDGSTLLDTTHYVTYGLNTGTVFQTQAQLINEYRSMALHSDVDNAIDDIINAMFVCDEDEPVVEVDLSDVVVSDDIKEIIVDEFEYITSSLLDFDNTAYEKGRQFYVDGRLHYQVIVDESKPELGIQKLINHDPRCLKKFKEVKKEIDPKTRIEKIASINSYYVYDPNLINNGELGGQSNQQRLTNYKLNQELIIDEQSIITIHSGVFNADKTMILSHLEKARKPLNNLKTLEDAVVIYRVTRAPERRIFYIDVGSLPKKAAEEYMQGIINRHKTKMNYDPVSGKITGTNTQLSMLEDYWLPRREGGKGTEIDTLAGGTALDQLDDLLYFQKKLWRALNVPSSRMEGENSGILLGGRGAEISRDEWKMDKFIRRLRRRFSVLFKELLKKQLILKNIATLDDWSRLIEPNIRFKYNSDSYMKDQQDEEAFQLVLQNLTSIDQYVGKYFSRDTVFRKVLKLSDEEISLEKQKMMIEIESGEIIDPLEMQQAELDQTNAMGQAALISAKSKSRSKS